MTLRLIDVIKLRIREQSANVIGDFDKTYRHEDRGSEERHPTRKAQRCSCEVNKSKCKKHDKHRTHRLQPGSPEDGRIVLLAELNKLGPGRVRRRTNRCGERHPKQDDSGYPAQSAENREQSSGHRMLVHTASLTSRLW